MNLQFLEKLSFLVHYIFSFLKPCFFVIIYQNFSKDSSKNEVSSSSSFGLFPIRGRHSRYLHFFDMAFVLQSDALPATNPLFRGKAGPPVFHIKVGASR